MTFALGPILQGLSPLILRLLGMVVESRQAKNEELLKKFKSFSEELEKSMETSARLRKSAEAQSKRLDAILNKLEQKK